MGIENVVLEYKKTKDKKLFNYIISHYKPIFKSSVRKYYGKSYDMEIDEVFEDLIKYYFENDLKDIVPDAKIVWMNIYIKNQRLSLTLHVILTK